MTVVVYHFDHIYAFDSFDRRLFEDQCWFHFFPRQALGNSLLLELTSSLRNEKRFVFEPLTGRRRYAVYCRL